MDAFTTAAKPLKKEIIGDSLGLLTINSTAVSGVILTLMLGKKDGHDQDLIETLSPDLYRKAVQLTPYVVKEDLINLIPEDRSRTWSPKRAWPLAVASAFCVSQNYERDGRIPGYDKPIFHIGPEFPEEFIQERERFSSNAVDTLQSFLHETHKQIRQHLNYPYEINPYWLPDIMNVALVEKMDILKDLRTWFPKCLDTVLYKVHEVRKSMPDKSYKAWYH